MGVATSVATEIQISCTASVAPWCSPGLRCSASTRCHNWLLTNPRTTAEFTVGLKARIFVIFVIAASHPCRSIGLRDAVLLLAVLANGVLKLGMDPYGWVMPGPYVCPI